MKNESIQNSVNQDKDMEIERNIIRPHTQNCLKGRNRNKNRFKTPK
jgi:hypothetical protein